MTAATYFAHVDAQVDVLNHDELVDLCPRSMLAAGDKVMECFQGKFWFANILKLYKIN